MAFDPLKIVRPFTRKGWWHWLRFALLLVGAGYVGHLMKSSPWLTEFRYSMYHRQLLMRDRSQLRPTHTALVLLNDDDYWGDTFQARTPLKRAELAAIVDKLDEASVNTVALDVDLRSPLPEKPNYEFADYTDEDLKLLAAVGRMCTAGRHVVLASSVRFGDDGYEQMPSIYTRFTTVTDKSTAEEKDWAKKLGCVRLGYIQLPFDMRRIPGSIELADGGHLDSMSLAVTGIADSSAYDDATAKKGEGFRFSEYLTPEDFANKNGPKFIFSGLDLRTTDAVTLRGQLADKLVFVGANWHLNAHGVELGAHDAKPEVCGATPDPDGAGPCVDMHNSPGGMEPGVMLWANYVEAMLDRTGTFTAVSDTTAELLEIGLALALAIIGVLEIHTAWKWAAFGIGIVLSILFTYTLLQNLGLFLDFLIPMLMIILHTVAEEALKLWHEFRHLQHSAKHAPHTEAAGGQR
jgi:CHASE2 domain-containing sensor protein